ncbi:MAG: PAS domain-containing protein [Anaerolineales bacterium]|nr:PAS domain-containing protein [Anaerolineales bacterium]
MHEVITDDTGQVVDFTFLDTNQAYDRHTGMNGRACIGKSILEVAPHADRRQIELYGKVALKGEPETFEYFSQTFGKHLRAHFLPISVALQPSLRILQSAKTPKTRCASSAT